MQADYLIIGQGISGTWLSYYLEKENKSFLVIDNAFANAPSRLAAGIINPVTGRRHATVWLAEEIFPFAWNAYTALGKELNINAISHKDIVDFFPSPQMRLSFLQRVEEQTEYVSMPATETDFRESFHYDFGYGIVKPVYTAHLENIIPAWRSQLLRKNLLLEEEFDITQLEIDTDQVRYKDITAGKIIFCDGSNCSENPWFKALPFAPNKGEALTLDIPDLSPHTIYKKGMMLVPLAAPGKWWIGSSYAWDFENLDPTPEFRNKTEQLLKEWLKVPFTITGHLSGNRPATLERRPFVGLHPLHPAIGILNGMGTKGCSLSPFFAYQLMRNLVYNDSVHPEADVKRFTRILSRNFS